MDVVSKAIRFVLYVSSYRFEVYIVLIFVSIACSYNFSNSILREQHRFEFCFVKVCNFAILW